jgi:hypothetical protein
MDILPRSAHLVQVAQSVCHLHGTGAPQADAPHLWEKGSIHEEETRSGEWLQVIVPLDGTQPGAAKQMFRVIYPLRNQSSTESAFAHRPVGGFLYWPSGQFSASQLISPVPERFALDANLPYNTIDNTST